MEELSSYPSFFTRNPAEMIRKHEDYYLIINAISLRVRQLQLGERALALPPNGATDPISIAQAELIEGKLEIVPRALARQNQQVSDDEGTDIFEGVGDDDDDLSFDVVDEEE